MTDPLNRTTRAKYDILNRDSTATGAAGDVTQLGYDGLGLHQVTDAIGQVYRFDKNPLGWDTLRVDPGGYSQSYTYDIMGNVVSWKNRRGQVTRFTYDSLGRIGTMTLANGRVTTYKYDPNGLWYSVANQNTIDTVKVSADRGTMYEISVRSGKTYLVTSYLSHGIKTGMRFDFVGRKYARDQAMTFYYDSTGADPKTGLLYGLAQTGFNERRTNLLHNADEQVSRVELPIGATFTATVDKSYSAVHDIIGERYSNSTAYDTLYGRGYSRDSLGRVTTSYRPVGDRGRTFQYDSAGRIASYSDFTATPGWTNCALAADGGCLPTQSITSSTPAVTFTYDAVGNRTGTGTVLQPGNRLTQINGYTYTFDADGNVTGRNGGGVNQTLYWNSINQLDSIWTSNNGMIRFYYDGFGRRTRKAIPNFAWNYHYSGMQLYADSKDDAGIVHVYKYYPGTDEVVSVTDWDKTYHFVKDASGNITGAINEETGTASNSYKYTPYGQIESMTEGFSNAIRFKGRYQDGETGLYENRARYYDPTAGRFISQDPIGLVGGMNPYTYGNNDPVNMSDPTGLHPGWCTYDEWKAGGIDNQDADGNWYCTMPTTLADGGSGSGDNSGYGPPISDRGGNGPYGPGSGPGPGSVPGSGPAPSVPPTPRPSTDPHYRQSCSWDAVQENMTNAAISGAVVGTMYGAGVGAVIGYTGGTVAGGAAGAFLGAPLGPAAIATAAAGGYAGGVAGAFAIGWVGAHAGFVSGAVLGASGAFVATLAMCTVNH